MIHISANWECGTMSTVDLIDEDDNESGIAAKAANVLRDRFKELNGHPIVIKHLSGRNPELAQRVASRGTFKIKKRKVSQD